MFMRLLMDFWLDLHKVEVWGQIAVITLCVVASYFISQFLSRRFYLPLNSPEGELIVTKSLTSLWFPTALLVLLYASRFFLLNWENAHLVSLLIPIIGSLALIRFGLYSSRRIFLRNHSISNMHLFLEKIFSTGIWALVIFYYIGLLQDMVSFMKTHSLSFGQTSLSLLEIVQALISVAVTVLLALLASATLEKRLMTLDSLDPSLRIVLSKLSRSFLIVGAILISLDLVGIDLTVLSVFGGALGIGLGLGLQKIASNYVSGFIVLFERSLAVNDLITVDKYSGKVSKISTRYTVLKGLDGIESILPNEMLISSAVQNLSSNKKGIAINTGLTVAYSTDIEALLPKLVQIVSKVDGVSGNSSPAANLTNFGINGFEIIIYFWIPKPEEKGTIVSKVNRAIWKLLQEQNIKIPYPQNEITVVNRHETITDNDYHVSI